MLRFIKIIISLLGMILLLAIATIVAIVAFINPNDYKAQISEQVHHYTGRELTLQGNIAWSFFPWLGLRLNDAALSNTANFAAQPFAQVKHVDIKIKFLPLFYKQVEVATLALDGLEVHLIKNAQGITNWQGLDSSLQKNDQTAPDKSLGTTPPKHHFNFSIATVDVTNGSITWDNQQDNQNINLTEFELHGKTIQQNQPFPVDLQFMVQSKQPDVHGPVKIATQLFANTDQQTYSFKQSHFICQLTGQTLPNKQLNLDLQGEVTINGNQHLVQGRLQTKQLELASVKAENVSLQFKSQNKIIDVNSIQAKIYQGDYRGNVHFDLNSKSPTISSHSQLTHIQAEPLFKDLADITSLQLSGVGNVVADLTTEGDNKSALLNNLNGQGKFALNNGMLHGINIPYWIGVGRSLLQKTSFPPIPNDLKQTDFGNLTGTFSITNGLLRNNDLLLKSTHLQAMGTGTADLINQQINYRLNAQLLNPTTLQPQGDTIPIVISGSFKSPGIRPEMKSIIKNVVKDNYEKNKKVINQQLQKFLGKDVSKKIQNSLENLFH